MQHAHSFAPSRLATLRLRQSNCKSLAFGSFALFLVLSQLQMNCQQQANRSPAPWPADLRVVEGLAGGVEPWSENHYLLITADRHAKYERALPNKIGAPPLMENDFILKTSDLMTIWQAIAANDFFALEPEYKDESIAGGWFASLTITASGKTHRVTVQNFNLPRFRNIIRELNNLTPAGNDLIVDEW
jgi:hypothetical protein